MKPFALFLFFAAFVFAAPSQERRDLPLYPNDDPFYNPPSGFELEPLGSIIRSRPKTNPFGIIIVPEILKGAYQLMVRSEDTAGNPSAIIVTVFVPFNADPSKLISYQIAEDSANGNCAPLYALQLGSDPAGYISSQVEQILVQAVLAKGYYVVVPDYEGLKSAFGAGHQAGKAVLNGVRGVLNSGSITGINKDAKVGYWGYSGGSIATGWAALLQPTYASDLEENSVGFAYGGIVADVEATANTNMGTLTAGLIFAAINGLSADYPELNDYVNSHVFPNKLDEFRNPTKECLLPVLLNFAGQSWDDYFVDGDNTLNDPVVKNVTSQNSMITSSLVPTSPLFFYNSIGDEIITATQADKLYSRLCAAGVSIQYNQDLIGEHITQQALGAGDALVWLEDRLNGKAAPSGCKKNEAFSNALNWNGITGLGQVFASALARILFVPLGPYDYLG